MRGPDPANAASGTVLVKGVGAEVALGVIQGNNPFPERPLRGTSVRPLPVGTRQVSAPTPNQAAHPPVRRRIPSIAFETVALVLLVAASAPRPARGQAPVEASARVTVAIPRIASVTAGAPELRRISKLEVEGTLMAVVSANVPHVVTVRSISTPAPADERLRVWVVLSNGAVEPLRSGVPLVVHEGVPGGRIAVAIRYRAAADDAALLADELAPFAVHVEPRLDDATVAAR
jgi:hypothetical protein